MQKINIRFGIVVAMILVAALSRILPHPYNFTPMVAIALFGGAQIRRKGLAFAIPLAAFFLSDLVISGLGGTGYYGISQLFVYGSMILITALGSTLGKPGVLKLLGYSLSGSAIFWLLSNFGVWAANQMAAGSVMHEPGLTLGMTYLRALPFYNLYSNQLFLGRFGGDLFYTGVLFGIFALAERNYPVLRLAGK